MRKAVQIIETTRLLTDEEVRQVKAALDLAGTTRKDFAAGTGVAYSVLSKTLRQKRVPSEGTAEALSALLAGTNWPVHSRWMARPLGL